MYGTVCSYDWDKDGEPLGSVSNIRFVGNGTVHITHLTPTNEGVYQCFAYNTYGRTMSTISELRMAVSDLSSPETNEIAAAEGQSLMIGCRPTTICFPAPQYPWELKSSESSESINMDRRRQIDQQGNCCCLHRPRKVFESGGSNCGDDERGRLCSRARQKAVLKWVREGVVPSRSGGPGVLPPEILEILCENGALWGKIAHFAVNGVDGA